MKKIKWEKLTRRGNNFSVLLISSVIRAYNKELTKKIFGISNPKYYRQLDGGRWFGDGYVDRAVKEIKHIYNTKPSKLIRIVEQYQSDLVQLRKWTQRYRGRNLASYKGDDLANIWEEFFSYSDKTLAVVYGYIFINRFLPDVLGKILKTRKLSNEEIAQYLNILLLLDRSSESKKEKKSILKIVKAVDEGRVKKNSKMFNKMIYKHLEEYAYLGQYYYKKHPYRFNDIVKRINFFLKSDYVTEIKELNRQRLNKSRSDALMKNLNFNNKEKTTVKILKSFAYSANAFDEEYTAAAYNFSSVIQASAKMLRLNKDLFIAMTCDEIINSLRKGSITKSFRKELLSRSKNDATIMCNNKEVVLSGKKLADYMKKEIKSEQKKLKCKEIKGQSAQPGIVRGIVHLVLNVEEVAQVKKGEILVSPATMPSHVPAMEKAKAVVTDEGGLLSHAAIVSRELGVPCVVGTKIGTRALQNGDVVEVDANRGIIKKI